MFKGNPALTGVVDAPPPRALLGVRFRFRADGPIRSTPALAAGVLFFGSDDGHLYAIDSRTGALKWRFAAGAGVTSSPAVVAGTVFFTAFDHTLYAVDAATGRLRWKTIFGADLRTTNYWDFYTSSPIPFAGALYVGAGDGHLYAVDQASGRKLWAYDAGARVRGTPAVTDKAVVFGTMAGHVIAVDRATGVRRWDFATDGAANSFEKKQNDTTSVVASPAIANGIVTVGGRDGNLYALDLATGVQRWKTTHDGGSWILSTAIRSETVYSGSGSAYFIQSAALATGKENWRFRVRSAVFGPVTIAGNVLIADDLAGNLYAVDAVQGTELWRFPLGDRSFAGVTIGNGVVYAATDNGDLYALDTAIVPPPAPVRHIVYAEPKATPEASGWFPDDLDIGILNSFRAAGYEQLAPDALVKAMEEQIRDGKRSVIVFADNHVPVAASDAPAGTPLIRRFLDAGGMVVFLGPNPLSFHFDAKGVLDTIDEEAGGKVLGLSFPPHPLDYGYHVSRYNSQAERWGLSGYFVTNGPITVDQVSTVLATDRIGLATAWTKNYGQRGLLLQVPLPRNRMIDLTPLRAAIDRAAASRAGS
jgi:outer membrane protein assembly factor BamB